MIISGLQAKAKDRQWLKNQTSGELDDTKLIEGKKKFKIHYVYKLFPTLSMNQFIVPYNSEFILCL